MAEDRCPKSTQVTPAEAGDAVKPRRKRKWDQPDESLISYGVTLPENLHAGIGGPLGNTLMPGASHSAAMVQKLILPKIQDEVIAREIVINDADPAVRYRLTKRQTQDEIQKSTGAVVITRGKYHSPNCVSDNEKPLYLHISAGAHLKDTAERIIAVDHAASMVEEILKHGANVVPSFSHLPSNLSTGQVQVAQPLSLCLFLGFAADPSMNIVARIRGPNDLYINHIMNETGASVILRGQGSGNADSSNSEDDQQPLHLFLSSSNTKSLEDARILSENLLDTICSDYGASRISSSKVYNAVPPPQQLLAGISVPVTGTTCTTATPVHGTPFLAPIGTSVSSPVVQPFGNPEQNTRFYSFPQVNGVTCYNGYGGIYPQATPLQQVALALRQPPPSTSTVAATSQVASQKSSSSSSDAAGKHPPQKRKFQESQPNSKALPPNKNSLQGSEFLKPGSEDSGVKKLSLMPPPPSPPKPVRLGSDGMPPPPPKSVRFVPDGMPPPPPKSVRLGSDGMPPPLLRPWNIPPPPKFSAPRNPIPKKASPELVTCAGNMESRPEPVPDPLLKLMEYGDDDDDDDDTEDALKDTRAGETTLKSMPKPFWAV